MKNITETVPRQVTIIIVIEIKLIEYFILFLLVRKNISIKCKFSYNCFV